MDSGLNIVYIVKGMKGLMMMMILTCANSFNYKYELNPIVYKLLINIFINELHLFFYFYFFWIVLIFY